MSAELKLVELNLQLPPAPTPMGAYCPVVIVGSIAYLSGHVPLADDGSLLTGKVGDAVDAKAGYHAARQTGLVMLSSLREALGSLDRVQRVVKLLGMVNCVATFHDLPAVINGCSELFAEVFGPDIGVGARSAVGVTALPSDITVEIEGIFEIRQ